MNKHVASCAFPSALYMWCLLASEALTEAGTVGHTVTASQRMAAQKGGRGLSL